jgi:hypothetical protein
MKKEKKDEVIAQYNRIYDCLMAIDTIQENNPQQYNEVISALIDKARDLVEEGICEASRIK